MYFYKKKISQIYLRVFDCIILSKINIHFFVNLKLAFMFSDSPP